MANHSSFTHQVWRAATLTLALAGCLIFGIIVLASGDWLPGGIIVGATTIGLAREIPVIRKLCNAGYPASPPKHRPVD